MKLDIRVIDGQFCKAQFYISAREVRSVFNAFENNDIFNNFKNDTSNNAFYSYIQETLIISEIVDRGYIPLKNMKYYYYNELNKTMPLYGIVFFVIVPENTSVSLPKEIPSYVNAEITDYELRLTKELEDEKNIKSSIGKYLVKLGLYDIVESDIVSDCSTVYYDLVKKVNGEITEEIDGLVMNIDSVGNESIYKQLIGTKLNDIAILVNNDEVQELHINKIIEKDLYTNEKYNKEKVYDHSFKNLKNLKETLAKAEVLKKKIEIYLNYISRFAYSVNEFTVSPRVIEFYKETYKNDNLSDEDIYVKIINEITEKIIESKIGEEDEEFLLDQQIKFLNISTNPMMFYVHTNLSNRMEVFEWYSKYLVLKFCSDNNITKGINL